MYERLPGWSKPTAGVRRYDDLPLEAKAYLARIAEVTGVPIALVSTGSDRADTILIRDGLIDRWQSDGTRPSES